MSQPCIYCRTDIPDGAVKCSECGEYQNWRKYLNFSSVILSLLIALISVLTVSIPVFSDFLKSGNADLLFNIIDDPQFTAVVQDYGNSKTGEKFSTIQYKITFPAVIANSGDKTGFLYRFYIKVKNGEGETELLSSDMNKIEPNSIVSKNISTVLYMDNYDKILKGWKVDVVDRRKELREDFGTASISLFGFKNTGEVYLIKSYKYNFGDTQVRML